MKWMKVGLFEGGVENPEPGTAPFGVWRREELGEGRGERMDGVLVEGLMLLPVFPEPAVQGSAVLESAPVEVRWQDVAAGNPPPIRIYKEGLLG